MRLWHRFVGGRTERRLGDQTPLVVIVRLDRWPVAGRGKPRSSSAASVCSNSFARVLSLPNSTRAISSSVGKRQDGSGRIAGSVLGGTRLLPQLPERLHHRRTIIRHPARSSQVVCAVLSDRGTAEPPAVAAGGRGCWKSRRQGKHVIEAPPSQLPAAQKLQSREGRVRPTGTWPLFHQNSQSPRPQG
jgi:hypothetical protein